jgi:hypothetical protein
VRVGNNARGSECREKLTQIERGSADRVPFFALAIEAIDVKGGGLSNQPRNPGNRTVSNIANEDDVGVGEAHVNQRKERVEGGIEMLARNRGQNDAANAGGDDVIRSRKRTATVHGDFMAARREASRKLFRERLKTAVTRRNASRPENGNLHLDSSNSVGPRADTDSPLRL